MGPLEFERRSHYGRHDYYPLNEAAKTAIKLKSRISGTDCKAFKQDELELLKALGLEIVIKVLM